MYKKGYNKLLEIITSEHLKSLLYTEALSPYGIAKKYGVSDMTVHKAVNYP